MLPEIGTGLAVFAFLNRSAAILTLVGTLFNLIAPPAFDEPLVNADSLVELAEGLNAEMEVSEAVVHGDGKGLRGETIDADVDKWATPGPLKEGRPLLIGILRASDAGLRNSDGRLCFAGLMLAYLIVNNCFSTKFVPYDLPDTTRPVPFSPRARWSNIPQVSSGLSFVPQITRSTSKGRSRT